MFFKLGHFFVQPNTRTFNHTTAVGVVRDACDRASCSIGVVLPKTYNSRLSFTCEVSTEGPRFAVVKQTKNLTVAGEYHCFNNQLKKGGSSPFGCFFLLFLFSVAKQTKNLTVAGEYHCYFRKHWICESIIYISLIIFVRYVKSYLGYTPCQIQMYLLLFSVVLWCK